MRVTEAVEDPAELVAVIKYDVAGLASVGVPLITQVDGLTVNPAGSDVEEAQLVIVAPLGFRVVGDTDIAVPTLPFVPEALA